MSKRTGLALMAVGVILFVLGSGAVVSLSIIPQTISGNQIICLPSAPYGTAYTSLCSNLPTGSVLAFNWVGTLLPSQQALTYWGLSPGSNTCGLTTLYGSSLPIGTAPFGTNYGTRWAPSFSAVLIVGDTSYTDGCGNPATTSGTASYAYTSTVITTFSTTQTAYFTSTATSTVTTTSTTTAMATTTATLTQTTTTTNAQGSTTTLTMTLTTTSTFITTSTSVGTSTTTTVVTSTTTIAIPNRGPYGNGTGSVVSWVLVLLGLFGLGAGAMIYIGGGRRR